MLADHHLRFNIEGLQPHAEVGPDADEGLAHDDKRRDVEDEIGGQIMKIQPVVEHEPADKGVEGKSQYVDEVGEKNYPLMGFGRRDDLPRIWQPVRESAARYPAPRSFVMFSSVTEETIHLPPAPDMLVVL